MQQIGFATCREHRGADDDRLVTDALRPFGFDVVPVIRDASETVSAVPPTLVICSCWNYHFHPRVPGIGRRRDLVTSDNLPHS
jgi:hypothetical protein